MRVQDVNDNSPHFSATSYRVSVQESVDVNTIFATVSAEDADAKVWADFCHVVFNVKEFIFLD